MYADLVGDWHTLVPTSNADTETFTADLVEPGFVLVTVSYGNDGHGLQPFQIEDGDSGAVLATNLSTQSWDTDHVSFILNVPDTTLDLVFRTLSTSYRTITLKSIDVVPGNLFSMGFAPPAAPLDADGTTIDTFTLASAPLNALITVETDLGTIVNSDADPGIDGIQVLTDPDGRADIFLQRPAGAGQAVVLFSSVAGQEIGCSVVEYGLLDTRLFDFDFQNNNPDTQAGYTSVLHTDMYSSERGHGWVTSVSSLGGTATGPLASLLKDVHRSSEPGTFRVDLPNGTYSVHAYFHDGGDHLGLQLSANGNIVLPAFDLEGSELVDASFEVAIAKRLDPLGSTRSAPPDRSLLDDQRTEIRPVTTVGPCPVNLGSLPADGLTTDTITANVTASDGTLVTVSSSLGAITSNDADPLISGVRPRFRRTGRVRSAASRSGRDAPPSNAQRTAPSTILTSPTFLTYSLGDTRRFDFNVHTGSGVSLTEPGFVGVLNTEQITSGNGYGWAELVSLTFD